ncbi:Translation initiation factor if-2 [Nesidiocoris tenuis]|uniref:Translation initiation factor IF-2, mitochondrial n=1 Tax=Nesidiocoris tenuis TaxID=355587 RepID=A0ABN7AZY1_9HEMI|nr:Translation initiation factor if-2 [Nesidiocoris tenuis]
MFTLQKCTGLFRLLSSEIVRRPVRRQIHCTCVLAKKRKSREDKKAANPIAYAPKPKSKRGETVDIWNNMTVEEVAQTLEKPIDHVMEVMTFIDNTSMYRRRNDVIDNIKIIEEIVKKSGHRCRTVTRPDEVEVEEKFKDIVRRNPSEYLEPGPRPPVVAIMGHVDHGKTTLLDYLRQSSIVKQEFGGITQHIGAFSVKIGKDNISFLDTPGHAAFISMRSRGAQSTDIVVLVVAADDGVMEQTVESIRLAKESNVPIIVAINKIDKPQANVERAKKSLMQHGIVVEDLGGDVQAVPVSALKGTNVDMLMEAILAQAELMELKSDYAGPAEGVVIESSTDPHRGKLCTVLVQCGTLKRGAILVAGTAACRVRAMFNDLGAPVQEATPSTPVQVLGWKDLPSAGDIVLQVTNDREAARIVAGREKALQEKKAIDDLVVIERKSSEHYAKYREQLEAKRKLGKVRVKNKGLRPKEIQESDEGPRLNIIVKGDVDGSVEAILDVLETYNNPKCRLDLVHYGVGPITQNDLVLAESFQAIVYAFNTKSLVKPPENIVVKDFNVIYHLVDDIKGELDKRLPPVDTEEVVGEASVLQEFLINEGRHKVPVAGCRCVKGSLKKSCKFRLVRQGETIFDGQVTSLRHVKDEVDTIKNDVECGIRMADASVRFVQGDTIVCYKINKIPDKIDWDPGF